MATGDLTSEKPSEAPTQQWHRSPTPSDGWKFEVWSSALPAAKTAANAWCVPHRPRQVVFERTACIDQQSPRASARPASIGSSKCVDVGGHPTGQGSKAKAEGINRRFKARMDTGIDGLTINLPGNGHNTDRIGLPGEIALAATAR